MTDGTDTSSAAQQLRTAARTTLTRLLTDQLDRVGVRPGQRVLDLTGAADREHLSRLVGPSGHVFAIDASHGAAHWSADPGGYDVVLSDRQPDQLDALAPMTASLRPGGWLILAGTVPVPPVVYTAVPGATSVIDRVIRAIHALTPAPAGPCSAEDTTGLLIALGVDHVCATTLTETSRGGGPGCTRYRHKARHLQDQLTAAGLSTAELDQFDRAMRDPSVVLNLNRCVTVHAQMSAV
ncbi:methyltransferase domain-containing protein [Micromonospora arborensis]|uniref:hypothetical protein n=1 Tax=Micromonospora arborensis TaxID=2116518 RepID=UPI00371F3A1E